MIIHKSNFYFFSIKKKLNNIWIYYIYKLLILKFKMEIMTEIGKIGKNIEKLEKIRNDYNGIIGNHFGLSLINFINKEETDSYDKNEIIDLIYKFIDLYSNKKDNKKSLSSTKSKKMVVELRHIRIF